MPRPSSLATQASLVLALLWPYLRARAERYVFFFFFFRFFSDQCCRDLFSPHAGSSNPHLSTVRRPSNLASPAAAIAGTQVKICFFVSFFFVPFLTNVTETLFTPHPPPLQPRKSPPPPPPCRTQVMTSASPLRHAQVRCHHPVTVRKTRRDTAPTPSQHGVQARLRPQPAPRKPRHVNTALKSRHANPLHTSPAATPPATAPRKSLTTNPPRPRSAHRRHCSLPIVVLASYLYLFNCNYILLCINVANGVTVT